MWTTWWYWLGGRSRRDAIRGAAWANHGIDDLTELHDRAEPEAAAIASCPNLLRGFVAGTPLPHSFAMIRALDIQVSIATPRVWGRVIRYTPVTTRHSPEWYPL